MNRNIRVDFSLEEISALTEALSNETYVLQKSGDSRLRTYVSLLYRLNAIEALHSERVLHDYLAM